MRDPRTLTLPGLEPADDVAAGISPARPDGRAAAIAAALPDGVRLGTSSWSFPGWQGIVWAGRHSRSRLAREGLAAYAQHPLLGAVGLDRTFYRPLSPAELAGYRDAVPEGFRFVVKAHEDSTVARFPDHPRHGARAGRENPRFLDPAYATDAFVGPAAEGLGQRLGAVVFQFPPQRLAGGAAHLAARLQRFLDGLPDGVLYAVEIRNRDWLTADYVAALGDAGAVHCLTVHPAMPGVAEQARRASEVMQRALVCRWNLGHGLGYEAAKDRYAPFDRMAAPDPDTREALAALCVGAAKGARPAWVIVNNKAEGSAPLSVSALAQRIAELCAARR